MVVLKAITTKRNDNNPRSMSDTVNYAEGNRLKDGEKCLYKNFRNFDPDQAVDSNTRIKTMEGTAALNNLCHDPIFHDMMSWSAGEIPTKEQIEEAIDIYLKEMNFEGCQCVYGLHQNTDFIHLHIVVNRVDPVTLKTRDPNFYKKHHEKIARIVELKQGWAQVNDGKFYRIIDNEVVKLGKNGQVIEKAIKQEAKDFERRSGEKSAIRIAQEDALPILWDVINNKTTTWVQLHKQLAEKGFYLKKSGRGAVLVYCMEDKEIAMKLSSLSQKLSLSNIEKHLGEFHPKIIDIDTKPQEIKPLNSDDKDMHEYIKNKREFNKEKKVWLKEISIIRKKKKERKAALLKRQKQERKKLFGKKGQWKGRGRELNVRRSLLAAKHLTERQLFDTHYKELEADVREAKQFKFPDYTEWQEQRNNPDAKWKFIYANTLTASISGEEDDQDLLINVSENSFLDSYTTDLNQQKQLLSFYKNNKLAFEDNGYRITIYLYTDKNIKDALLLAQEKWGHARLYGPMSFKKKAIEIAIQNGIEIVNPELQEMVRMKKEELEKIRQEAGTIAQLAPNEVKEHINYFNDYTLLLGTDKFRITCSKPLEDGGNKTFVLKNKDGSTELQAYEIQAQWNEIEKANSSGFNVYITPIPEDNKREIYILVDDLTKDKLAEMKTDGFNPTYVLESSPGNYQAIIVVEKQFLNSDERAKNINKQAANKIMQELNTLYGDKNIRAAIHPHRIPGMNNNKLKRIAENGGKPPQVRLIEINTDPMRLEKRSKQTQQERRENKISVAVHCRLAQIRFDNQVRKISQELKEEEKRRTQILNHAINRTGTINPVDAFILHANDIIDHYGVVDYSRLDAEVVTRMRATGYSTAEIKEAVIKGSPAIRPKEKQNKQWENYAEKTAKYSESYHCLEKVHQQEHRIGAWLALEGRSKKEQTHKRHI